MLALGLLSVANTFMRLMVEVVKPHLGESIVICTYDSMSCSTDSEEHLNHIAREFTKLCDEEKGSPFMS